jgi:hypothetical protein
MASGSGRVFGRPPGIRVGQSMNEVGSMQAGGFITANAYEVPSFLQIMLPPPAVAQTVGWP